MTESASFLVAVDGLLPSDRATSYAAGLAKATPGAVVHLLNVQPSVGSLVTTFISKGDVGSYHREEGEKALASAVKVCADAGVACKKHVGVGRPGEVIGRFARKLEVRAVISGTRGHGGVVGVLLGSVAQDILAHVDAPVTFVK
ncbi:MAG: universal stress protein [Alphaproteobacteria bacterium]|nr:universal stress protein [Alphaproteobacteria bacterium]